VEAEIPEVPISTENEESSEESGIFGTRASDEFFPEPEDEEETHKDKKDVCEIYLGKLRTR